MRGDGVGSVMMDTSLLVREEMKMERGIRGVEIAVFASPASPDL